MKANEIRIGNIFLHTNENGTFNVVVKEVLESGINTHFNNGTWFIGLDNIRPIPLTEEILIKAGFERGGYNLVEVTHPKYPRLFFVLGEEFKSIWWNYNISGTFKECEPSQIEITYLHQLQNLIFALTGEEIKIDL